MLEIILIVVAALLFLVLLFVLFTYNRLITLRNRVDHAWAQIDVQLKRRYDLIPNLVEIVKGYAKHEQSVLMEITKYRAQLVTGSIEERGEANSMLTQALKSLFMVAENYPNLKANENFKLLQEELVGTENKVQYVRTAYNDYVMTYKTVKETFPTNMLLPIFGTTFPDKQHFQAEGTERLVPTISFQQSPATSPASALSKAVKKGKK
jgi:LemA protein